MVHCDRGWQSSPSWQAISPCTTPEDWDFTSHGAQYRQRHPDGDEQMLAQLARHFRLPPAWQDAAKSQTQGAGGFEASYEGVSGRDRRGGPVPQSQMPADYRAWIYLTQVRVAVCPSHCGWCGQFCLRFLSMRCLSLCVHANHTTCCGLCVWAWCTQVQQALCISTAASRWLSMRSDPTALNMGLLYWYVCDVCVCVDMPIQFTRAHACMHGYAVAYSGTCTRRRVAWFVVLLYTCGRQLNDIWPGYSWSSLDYPRQTGATPHWKPLHYAMRRLWAPMAVLWHVTEGHIQVCGHVTSLLVPCLRFLVVCVLCNVGADTIICPCSVLCMRTGQHHLDAANVCLGNGRDPPRPAFDDVSQLQRCHCLSYPLGGHSCERQRACMGR